MLSRLHTFSETGGGSRTSSGGHLCQRATASRASPSTPYTPAVTTLNPHGIDWAEVAARARADLGDEPVARFSDRFRMIVMVAAEALRPGDSEGLRIRGADARRVNQSRAVAVLSQLRTTDHFTRGSTYRATASS